MWMGSNSNHSATAGSAAATDGRAGVGPARRCEGIGDDGGSAPRQAVEHPPQNNVCLVGEHHSNWAGLLQNRMYRDLGGAVVAVTGASAGVGRAAALCFARHGAHLALMARDPAALASTKAEIEASGGQAHTFPLDIADGDAVDRAAEEIEEKLGPIQVWVNNAMVTVFGRVVDLTAEEIGRVNDVCYLGTVNGTLAALRRMRERNRGVIVQVGSALAYRGIPLQAAYCAAKHAARGFTDSLRGELIAEGSKVALTMVHLPAINTPQFEWARSKREKLPRPVAPVHDAAAAAEAIVHAARYPAREYWLGVSTAWTILGNMVAPRLADRILAATAIEGQDRDEPRSLDRRDNLFTPVSGKHATDGPFRSESRRRAMVISAATARLGVVLLGAGLAAGVGALAAAAVHGGKERGRRTRRR